MLIDRSLGDLLKYDDLNVDRFKLWLEFVEYYYVSKQQVKEKDDKSYSEGLSKELELYAKARTDAYLNRDSPVDENGNIVHSSYGKREAYPGGVDFMYNQSQAKLSKLGGANGNYSRVCCMGNQHRQRTCNTWLNTKAPFPTPRLTRQEPRTRRRPASTWRSVKTSLGR